MLLKIRGRRGKLTPSSLSIRSIGLTEGCVGEPVCGDSLGKTREGSG